MVPYSCNRCGHCKRLAPEIQGYPTIKILRSGGNAIQEYKGPREADGLVAYLKKQAGLSLAEIKSREDSANLIDEKRLFVAGVFPVFSGESFQNFSIVAEKLRADYDFGHTLDAKLLPHGGPVDKPTLRLLKPFDELFADFQVLYTIVFLGLIHMIILFWFVFVANCCNILTSLQDFQVDQLEKFIEEASIPTVTIFGKNEESSFC
nr:protein disulfide-isomerase-like [Ipomoea batatas]